jgi:hypothetical protein
MKKRFSLVIAAVAASQLGSTECGQVIKDPGFDVWCGNELCSWKLIRGDIQRVGTWHDSDSGVSFLGSDAAIQQVSPVNSFDGNCIKFTMVADVESTTETFLNVDLEADGSIERAERIPTASWQPITILLSIGGSYDGIRFELSKAGNGRAVLANMGAEIVTDGECAGLSQIVTGPRPLGATCSQPADCGSNICHDFHCAGCDPAASACGTGDVCGVGDALSPTLDEPLECIPIASHELGEKCVSAAECASGKCNAGRCSSCDGTVDCAGAACGLSWGAGTFIPGPHVCRPGEQAGVDGAACGADADCASGACNGSERKECFDGRPCQTRDDCPPDFSLTPGECTTVGIQGGTCS